MNDNHVDALAPSVPHDDPSVDAHRFSAEPPQRKNNTALKIIFVFVCLMGLIGAGVYVTKIYLRDAMQEREARKKERELAAKGGPERKARKFDIKDFVPISTATASTEKATPAGLGGAKPGEPGATSGAVPIALRHPQQPGGTAGQAFPAKPPIPPSSMMLDGDVATPTQVASAAPTAGYNGQPPGAGATTAETLAYLEGLQRQAAGGAPAGPGAGAPASGAAATNNITMRGAGRGNVQDFARAQAAKNPITGTAQATAANLGDRSYVLARGSYIPCILETQLYSNVPGESGCLVPDNVYSDNGKVLLIEKGSHVTGSYGNTLRQGDHRIAVVWSRIKTTTGIVIDVESPAADGVGTMGVDGFLDNHWVERIGAAFLLSLVEDAVAIEVAKKGGNTSTQPSATANTTKSMSEKVLESTINIPPTLSKDRGTRLMIYVKRDLWFDSVYKLARQ